MNPRDRTIQTLTIEGYFSVFTRGMKSVYQRCGRRDLHRYFAENNFRHNERAAKDVNDLERTSRALSGIVGKRLKCRESLAA